MTSVIITGTTGLSGSAMLKQCLKDKNITRITSVTRRALPIDWTGDPRLHEIVHEDFSNYDKIAEQLAGHDACFWCQGVPSTSVSQEDYMKITHDYPLAAAKAMYASNPSNFTFCYLSGAGADSSEKSMFLFARVKGKAENSIQNLGRSTYAFRPAYIHSYNPPMVRPFLDRVIYSRLAPFFYKHVPSSIINGDDLAKGMLHVARTGGDKFVWANLDILEAARKYDASFAE